MSEAAVAATRSAAADYIELTKPRITLMVVLTAFVGFALGSTGGILSGRLAATLAGTALVAAGASCFNMLLERRTDSLMLRTRNRPLPAGRLRPPEALVWGLALTTTGLLPRFEGRIFSAQDVARGKPEPDLFLHAARSLGVRPERCAVIEDSPLGVEAANRAGMTAFGFARMMPAERLREAGGGVFASMEELPALLAMTTRIC